MVERISNAVDTKMPTHGSSLSTYVYFMLYVSKKLHESKWIIYNIVFEVEFNDEIVLDLIPYSYSIRDFLKS